MTTKELVSRAMKELRSRVKPENCVRSPAKARKAQRASVRARMENKNSA